MSRLFPHPPQAEDQPLARTILTTHVVTRGVTTGAIIGAAAAEARRAIRARGSSSAAPPPLRLLRPAATGGLAGAGLAAAALALRMRGREHVEWQDRSWRLMANRGQLETDDWTYAAMGVAAAAGMGSPRVRALGWVGVAGAVGLGSVGGMLGYLAWRHGVHGGRFPDGERHALTG